MELKEAIQQRKSHREFSTEPLTEEQYQYLYWAAYKVPSAGALYPLALQVRKATPAEFIICANFDKTTVKYGKRGISYVYMEAGHTAQNLCLIATELGLGSLCVGAFDNEEVKKNIKCLEEEYPIYIVLVGNKRSLIC